jgi:hypothetical protein
MIADVMPAISAAIPLFAWRNRNAHDKTLRELVKRANVA